MQFLIHLNNHSVVLAVFSVQTMATRVILHSDISSDLFHVIHNVLAAPHSKGSSEHQLILVVQIIIIVSIAACHSLEWWVVKESFLNDGLLSLETSGSHFENLLSCLDFLID